MGHRSTGVNPGRGPQRQGGLGVNRQIDTDRENDDDGDDDDDDGI